MLLFGNVVPDYAMRASWEVEYWIVAITRDFARYCTLCLGCFLGPRAGLNALRKRRIFAMPGKEPEISSPKPVSVLTELSRILYFILFDQNNPKIRKPININLIAR
jgi:hypothetical protein